MQRQVAIVMTEVFLRRLTPALIPFVRSQHDFRILSIRRPIEELHSLLRELNPSALITEWLPRKTDQLFELKLPTIIVDTDDLYPGAVCIDVDDWQVGAEAARAFMQAGYRNFACLGNATPYSDQRIQGFERELKPGAVCSVHHEAAFEVASYGEDFLKPTDALMTWLRHLPKPVAIFAVHDPLGRFLCNTCRALKIRVPDDVAVIGANNDELVCGLSYPMLSSVSIPWDVLGETVGQSLQSILAGAPAPAKSILVKPSGVVLRHSANHLAIEDPVLRKAMSYFSKRIQDPITVGTLCHDLRIARRSLERKFREYYQCTPWEMLSRMRVQRAKQLILETNHSVSTVSELCGFNDPERMAVVYKRIEGHPPSQLRRSQQG